MRSLFIIILTVCLFSWTSNAQAPLETLVDFEVEQQPMAEALVQLGRTAGVPISFSNNILPKKKLITIQVKHTKVKTILTQMVDGTDVQFKAVGSQIVLFYKKRPKKTYIISGYIKDETSGERLVYANVYDKKSGRGTISNDYGFFSLPLEEGKIELVSSYLGYNSRVHRFTLEKDASLSFALKPNLTLKEIIVTPEIIESVETTEPLSSDKIPIAQMKKLPSLGGEADLFRMVELMPGVQSGSDGLGGLHVRGGSADQNLILMDGVPIYNASHSLGIFSIFNPEAIKSVELYKGAFPARYGGRLSSIMDVHTREGNLKKWTGNIKAGLIASTARIEGPILKDKASLLITARRTLLDQFIKSRTRKEKAKDQFFIDEFGVPLKGFSSYSFFDFNAKMNFEISEKDKFYFSYYAGGDEFHDEDFIVGGKVNVIIDSEIVEANFTDAQIQNNSWGNKIGVFRWNHIFKNNLFLNTTFTRSIYNFNVDQSLEEDIFFGVNFQPYNLFIAENYISNLKDWGAKLDFNYTSSNNHRIRFGINGTHHTFQPGAFGADFKENDEPFFEIDIDSFLTANQLTNFEFSGYIEDEFSVGKNLSFNIGILGNVFFAEEKTYYIFQPRFSFNYKIIKDLQLRGGFSRMAQPLHLVTGSDAGFPNDLWVPSTKLIPPQTSWQGVIGLQYQAKKSIEFSLEGYYKKLDNLITYLDNAGLREDQSNPSNFSLAAIDSENWESQVSLGEGWSYGLEFQVKKNTGRMTGWLSYTWAFAERQFPEVNRGAVFPYRYDRRHNFNVGLNYRFTNWLELSSNWTYGTGISTLIPVGKYQLGDLTLLDYEFTRMPANHRLDLGLNLYYKTWGLKHTFYLGAYNVYNRANPQYYQLKTSLNENSLPGNPQYDYKIYQGSFLPFLPSISYSIDF